MIVETGPNGSTSWIAGDAPGIVGAQQDRRDEGAIAGDRRARRDRRRRSAPTWRARRPPRAPSRSWSRLASAPICTPSSRGSPIRTLASRSASASWTASRCSAGAMARRMAVHFWPALTVISRATSLTNRSNSGVPGAASGPRIEALRLSRSATKRTLSRAITGCDLQLHRGRRRAGEADHVLQRQMIEQVAGRAHDQLQRALAAARRPRS